jgi:hypothetical protein
MLVACYRILYWDFSGGLRKSRNTFISHDFRVKTETGSEYLLIA